MIRLKFNSAFSGGCSAVLLRCLYMGLSLLSAVSVAWAGQVAPESARRVAQGQVLHHTAIFGNWNGAASPAVGESEIITLEGGRSAYHFQIQPTGYVIVAASDNLSPIPFYSARSAFDLTRAENPNSIEAWIVARLNTKAAAASAATDEIRIRKAGSPDAQGRADRSRRVGKAWSYFDRLNTGDADQTITRNATLTAADEPGDIIPGELVAPLLTTQWAQDAPYNLETPDDGCISGSTLTGCVATAWSQLLRYWQWPPPELAGQGSRTYQWKGATVTTNLSADLTDPAFYDWANMPNDLNAPEVTQVQKDAVAKLIYAVAIAVEMDFGCPESGQGSGSLIWADEVLDTFFRFKPLDDSNRLSVLDYTSAQWLSIIKSELEADPPRPIIFSMDSQLGWHEVVIDGYQTGVADKVHINFGWEGHEDAYFDITDDDDFNAGGFDWTVRENQTMVIGIAPDNAPPVIQVEDMFAYEADEVTLSVTSEDPEGVGASRYLWTQISGPEASIANAQSPNPTITVPFLGFNLSDREMVFEVKVYDASHASTTGTCTVTIRKSGSGDGGGGCFLGLLQH